MKIFRLILLLLFSHALAAQIDPQIIAPLKSKLNSERIEHLFGSYGVELLDINSPDFSENRISNLHSLHNGVKVMRTLAIVDFAKPVHGDLIDAHDEIQAGGSIGAVLKRDGWKISKVPLHFSVVTLSPNVMLWMDEPNQSQAALHMYKLEVARDSASESIHYCTIIEIHSPQYLTSEHLQALNGDHYERFNEKTDEVSRLLAKSERLLDNFPRPLKVL